MANTGNSGTMKPKFGQC